MKAYPTMYNTIVLWYKKRENILHEIKSSHYGVAKNVSSPQ